MLAVLSATGIASPHVAMNDSWAVKALHAAAQGGSAEASLALSHRYFMADGVPGNCQEGFRSAPKVAAAMSYEMQTFDAFGVSLVAAVCIWMVVKFDLASRSNATARRTDITNRMILVVLAK